MSKHLLIALACACTAACSTTPDDYPSLELRDAERVSGTLQPPEPYVPEPLAAATLENVHDLYLQAMAAHESFLAKLGPARTAVLAARGAGVGSEGWARASVAIADVETERSRTMVALADLDRLYVAAATGGAALEELEGAQQRVSEVVAEETAKIDEMLQVLAR